MIKVGNGWAKPAKISWISEIEKDPNEQDFFFTYLVDSRHKTVRNKTESVIKAQHVNLIYACEDKKKLTRI